MLPQIYGYRMSLWAEHIGGVEASFERPDTLECVQRVRGIGETNWKRFVAEEVTEMRGHLIRYPVAVDWNGKVGPLPGCAAFPDVGGKHLRLLLRHPGEPHHMICSTSSALISGPDAKRERERETTHM
ncbi:Phospholipase D beta 1 [Hordeum vulgare]|nr:Phospholipase D beta 1 [Hordeum vulgare]